ncbi:hypothetical protein OKA04_24235 [Luteolibacter flavescens]|uniref:Uncharacterized protein n=1 Tax=Luteolibacter flavescens TaxID=1859460 RepID=A0ABT3FXA7_9BACT|nr:hypothetical protein [Luteolibacter flavescens]MCW1887869.1 hypothetical protein [Luteolibacter flavescens]
MSAEPPNSSGLPGRSRPALSDLSRETTEDDLWNLDEDPTPAIAHPPQPRDTPKTTQAPPKEVPASKGQEKPDRKPPVELHVLTPEPKSTATRHSPLDEIGDLEAENAPAPAATPAPAPAPAPRKESPPKTSPAPASTPSPSYRAPAPEVAEDEEYDQHSHQAASPAPEEEPPRARAAASAAPTPRASLRPRLNRAEVISIATFAVVAMIAAIWIITRFSTQFSFTRASDAHPDFPLKGQSVEVDAAETFWREPIRTGEDRDVARREVQMIPVVEVTLDPGKSSGGSLRVVFKNGQGEPVGDAITRGFSGGRFDASGSPTFSFAATDGFIEQAHFQAYRAGKGDYWTAELLEAPPGQTSASAFKKLSSVPLLPSLR